MRSAAKRFIKDRLRQAGYDVHRLPTSENAVAEGSLIALENRRYSPWLTDESFRATYDGIASHTTVDRYRCYELWQLVDQAAKLASGDLIEIGVWRGGSGCLIAKRCELSGLQSHVYLCDTFKGVVKASELDPNYIGGEFSDTSKEIVLDLARSLQVDSLRILEGVFPDETGALIEDRSFRLCHIDVDVYQSARDIVDWIWDRIVPGGFVVYDDYGFIAESGVTRFVNEERLKHDRLVIYNLNGHAVVVKLWS
jgi:O-methyltransferase